ncbi:MAG: hypothetical protein OEW00_04415 [candidate division Zixibacteria bacterium]|nr:hypothetical protein [candidate division Zixibacteria bacterium]
MKAYRIGTLALGLSITVLQIAISQEADETQHAGERFPDIYTLEAARNLMTSGEQSVALWYCINLYGDHPTEVLKLICDQRETSNDLVSAVKASFAANGPLDPATSTFSSGTMNVDASILARKGARADSLCSDIERELIEKYFVNDVMRIFAVDYEELAVPAQSDNLLDQVDWVIGKPAFSGNVSSHIHYLKARQGREVRDYDGEMLSRINVAVLSINDRASCDSIWNSILRTMEVHPPLSNDLPEGVKSPPTVLVKGSRSVVLVKFRCEDFLTADGVQDNSAFWKQAELVAALIKGCRPDRVLACGCGGPLRDMDDN